MNTDRTDGASRTDPYKGTHVGPQQLVSLKEIAFIYNICYQIAWNWSKNGKLPPPIKASPKCYRWRLDQVRLALGG
jgi:hypothetical protein